MNPYIKTLRDIGPIIFRHVFLLVNGVIFSVVALLLFFGSTEVAIFLGAITVFNMLMGIIQDTRARIALETLQMITALRVNRINPDGGKTSVLMEEVKINDRIELNLGDQVPCDGTIISSVGLEISEALLTGESDSIPKTTGDNCNAGDIVTAGRGVLDVRESFSGSRISKMTEAAKKYSAKPSPIESAVNKVIKYTGYCLILVIGFIVVRGLIVHDPSLRIVMNIGALASMIVPQGLVVITTLLFAFGAASYSKKHVLFQEINATEKLGRIKNLCMDKTGTLTDNALEVEEMHIREGISAKYARTLVKIYLEKSGDVSQTLVAVDKYFNNEKIQEGIQIISALPFSSWRQFGSVTFNSSDNNNSNGDNKKPETVIIGSTDKLLVQASIDDGKEWLSGIMAKYAHTGKRILCVVKSDSTNIVDDLSNSNPSIIAVFVFKTGFRAGVEKAIKFFQDRGVRIRIISGDSLDTVRSVALAAGIYKTEAVITGTEMKSWSQDDFDRNVKDYTIFARIVPEQKVKIIEAFKKDGFTAMVGDGANDALAIKKADLGIAMFDGVQATRRLAGVILMKNSFNDLPGGVELADNFIRNITILASAFINSSLAGLFSFILISALGYAYPITPLNITFINYFVVGLPGVLIAYWAIRPSGKILPTNSEGFLRQILPISILSATVQAIVIVSVFILSPESMKIASSNMLVVISMIVSGFIFFVLASNRHKLIMTLSEKYHLMILTIIEICLFILVLKIPILVRFFTLPELPESHLLLQVLLISAIGGVLQYVAVKFTQKKK